MKALFICLICFLTCVSVAQCADPDIYARISTDPMAKYSCFVWDIASSMYQQDLTNKILRIMTVQPVQDDNKLVEYTDGEWVVTSIGVNEQTRDVYLQFVSCYNGFIIKEIDALVFGLQLKEAKKRLLLLDHYCSFRGQKDVVTRLAYVLQMEAGNQSVMVNYKGIAREEVWLPSQTFDHTTAKVIRTNDLFGVSVNKLKTSTSITWEH